ncbi:MAG: O-antigen ligase family protein, partial [Candidatus Spyradenecus sp.]
IAMLAVVLLADLLFSIRKWDKLYLLLLFCTPIVVFRTGSRTAMGTLLAGLFFVFLLFVNARGLGARWKTRATSALMTLGIIGGCLLFITPQMREKVVSFMYKSGGNTVAEEFQTVENLVSTRQGLMDNAITNFKESPWIGNGFQVSEDFAHREIVSWKQVLSAPIEKGVWVTAVLEEGGVFGMLLFVIFILTAIFGLLSRQAITGAAALFIFIISNLGEFTFFSMSYTGGLMWAMVFTGVALDAQRLKEDRLRRQMALQVPVTISTQGYRF